MIRPLGLTHTSLPAPGQRSIKGARAHGYGEIDGKTVDLTRRPIIRRRRRRQRADHHGRRPRPFLDALLSGRLFRHRRHWTDADLAPAQGEGGLVGYGLGIERRALPGGVDLIGHLGGAGYRSYVGRLRPPDATIALAMNAEDDPTPLLLPAVKALLATHR